MLNLDEITNENNKKHNKKWPFIPDLPYRIFAIGGSGSGKTSLNAWMNKWTRWYWKINLYAKYSSKPKHEILIKSEKILEQSFVTTQRQLLAVQILWMTSMRILMITTQTEKKS